MWQVAGLNKQYVEDMSVFYNPWENLWHVLLSGATDSSKHSRFILNIYNLDVVNQDFPKTYCAQPVSSRTILKRIGMLSNGLFYCKTVNSIIILSMDRTLYHEYLMNYVANFSI